MRDNRRFQKGSGTYECEECGKQTRETGEGESSVGLCRRCYLISGWLNSYEDGSITREEFEAAVAKLDE